MNFSLRVKSGPLEFLIGPTGAEIVSGSFDLLFEGLSDCFETSLDEMPNVRAMAKGVVVCETGAIKGDYVQEKEVLCGYGTQKRTRKPK